MRPQPFTVHDLRRTGSTLLNEIGFNRNWIEKCLAHEDGRSSRSSGFETPARGLLSFFDARFHFGQVPHYATWRQIEAAWGLATALHFVDRRFGQGDDLPIFIRKAHSTFLSSNPYVEVLAEHVGSSLDLIEL